ncbi:MAG: trehalose-phosphatase [Bryobacteraceae bacterium]
MQYILSRASRPVLEELAAGNTLCAFDFDGTLAPIVDHPMLALLRPRTKQLLSSLARVYPCAVLSGRSRADLRQMLLGTGIQELAGNHGAEISGSPERAVRRDIARWVTAIEEAISPMDGVWIEDKGLSIAVHFRAQPNKREVRVRVARAAASLNGVRVFGGKQVVNLVPIGAPHKGEALTVARDRLGCERILYVGDDVNDEDAFALGGAAVSIRVGKSKHSKARYFLRYQSEVDKLLETLLSLRASQGHPERAGHSFSARNSLHSGMAEKPGGS